MTHKRIRKFNTKRTHTLSRNSTMTCAQVVVTKSSMVFVRGQVGQELDTAVNVAISDAAGQTEQAMKNVRTLLAEAGAELGDICKITIYITDPRYRRSGLSQDRRVPQRGLPGLDWNRGVGAGAAGMAGRSRCDGGHPRRSMRAA